MDQAPHPCVVAGAILQAQLFAQDVLQGAVLELLQTRVGDANILVERAAGIATVALEPPSRRIDPQRHEPVESGQTHGGTLARPREVAPPDRSRLGNR